jgi:Divergent InlB B-repeat domain
MLKTDKQIVESRATNRRNEQKPKFGLSGFCILLFFLLGLQSYAYSAEESAKPNAAGILQKLEHLTEKEQQKANSEANAFRLADITNTSTNDAEGGEVIGATGALPPSAEEERSQRKYMRGVKKVLLNKIGLARLNAERKKKGLNPLEAGRDVQVAPFGKDVITADPESAEPLAGGAAPDGATPTEDTSEPMPAAGSIAAVDNSALKYFPPIGNQGSVNSCVHWADMYYNLTHEIALQRDWDAKTGGDFYRFAPMFTYNFVNGGANVGTSINGGFSLAYKVGCVRKSEKPTSSDFKSWLRDNPDAYRRAFEARISSVIGFANLDRDAGLQTLKDHLANGHVATYRTYINSWQYKTVSNDPSTSDDDAYAGKQIAYNMNGTDGGHEMTVCGYNDSIWCDLNGNASVDTGEKGALLIANSWGTGYKNGGFCWVAYSALKSDIFGGKGAAAVSVGAAPHTSTVIGRLTINHTARNQVSVKLGIGNVGATVPASSWSPNIVNIQGGNYAFSGVAPTPQDMTYDIDFTDLAPSMGVQKRWFLSAYDSTGAGDLTIKSFELYFVSGGVDQLVGTAANTPVVVSGTTGYAWIDWTMGDVPPVASASASDNSASETGPETGAWTVTRTGSTASPLDINFAVSGTASNGVDYTLSTASPLTIPAGQASATITLTPVDDSVADEGTETATLTLISGTGYAVVNADGGMVSILENDHVVPVVTNLGGTALSATSAIVSGVTSAGRDVSAWICWGPMDGGTNSIGNWTAAVPMGVVTQDVAFSATLTGLATNRTYWYRCLASNVAGVCWSPIATSASGTPAGSTGGGEPVAGTYFEWDASKDAGGDNVWSSTTANVYNWTFASNLSPIVLSDARFDKVTAAYAFPAAKVATSATWNGKGDTQPATFEFVIEVNGTNGSLFETGGSGDGLQVDIVNGVLRGTVAETTPARASYQLAAQDIGRLIHIVFVADNVNNVVQLYVDGGLKDSQPWTLGEDWCGTDSASLGGMAGSQPSGGSTAEFNGKIALFRYYRNHAFSDVEVSQNFAALSSGGSAVANLTPTSISDSGATLNAKLIASGTNYDVYVYYGASDGNSNAASWTSSAYVGSWTNVSTNVSHAVSGLMGGQSYYYTFAASNTAGIVYAAPSWNLVMPGESATCSLTVSSAHGTAIPNGVSQQLSNSVVNASIIGSPVFNGTTQYVCTGWAGTGSAPVSGSGASTSFTIKKNSTITWIWATNIVVVHTVVFDEGAHGSRAGGGALTQQVVEATAAVAPVITPDTGYVFDGWDAAFDAVASNMTIHAQYSPIQFTLTYLAGPNGSISGTATQAVDFGADGLSVTAEPDTGYHFSDWSDGSTVATRSEVGVTEDLTVTANFKTNIPPLVTHGAGAVSVTATEAMLQGVLSTGETADAWICWGTTDGGTTSTGDWPHVVSIGAVAEGVAFSNLVTGLSTNTTYFYRCCATNAYGCDWSDTATMFSGTPVGGGAGGGSGVEVLTPDMFIKVSDNTTRTSLGSVTPGNASAYYVRGRTTESQNDMQMATFIHFDLGSIPAGASVTSAKFVIDYTHQLNTVNSMGVLFGRNTQGAWDTSGTKYPLHDWARKDEDNTVYAETLGTLVADVKTTSAPRLNITNDVTQTVSDWVAGIVPNDGFALYCDSDADQGAGFANARLVVAFSAGATIANKAPTAIGDTTATFSADLDATGTNYDVYVYYGTSDGGTNAAGWGTSAYVGSWTNVSANVSYSASGLTAGTTYHYAFMASNAAGRVWASPSWTFKTPGSAPQFTVNHAVPHLWLSGINPAWSTNYEAAALSDPDGDGFTTWQEYWSGTDPQDSNLFLKIDSITLSGSNLVFTWRHAQVDAGLPPITIQARSNLVSGSWVGIGTHLPTNGVNLWSGGSSVQGFYRLAVTNAP